MSTSMWVALGLLVLLLAQSSSALSQPHISHISTSSPLYRFFVDFLDKNGDQGVDARELAEVACLMSRCHEPVEEVEVKAADFIRRFDVDNSRSLSTREYAAVLPPRALLGDDQSAVAQVHLMVTTNITEMVVMWVTFEKVPSNVRWGLSASSLSNTASGSVTTYDVGILGGWHGWVHEAKMTGLSSSTRYFYQVGSAQGNTWSDVFSFRTAPAPSDPAFASQTFAVLGDMGTYIPAGFLVENQIEAAHKKQPFDMVVHVGDISYAGTGGGWEIEKVWDVWENMVQPMAANAPWMFCVGNHEMWYNFTAYRTRFDLPGDQSGGNGNFWYSFDYGLVHFVMMSTEHPYAPGTPQYNWLLQDLQAANAARSVRPWIIVSGHRPIYNTDIDEWSDHRPGCNRAQILEPLFLKYGVDVWLSGHMHMYERVHPNINGTVLQSGNSYVNPKAPVYMTQGNGGAFTDSKYIEPQPDWSAARNGFYGFARMTVTKTTLTYQNWREHDGSLNDQFTITKTA